MRVVPAKRDAVVALVVLGLLLGVASVQGSAEPMISSTACAGADAVGGSAASRVRAMRCLVAAARRDGGRRPLKLDPRLTRSAAAKARDIARCARFDHDPCAHGWAVGIRRARYRRVAENLAFAQGATPRQVITEWLASPEHRKDLLSPDFRATGLARRMAVLPAIGAVELWVQQLGG
jgi:uncharacterized protein YkwD